MKQKKEIPNLKRRYSVISIITIVVLVAVFSVFQYIYMDDIFLYAKKQDMIDVANHISALDPTDETNLSALADFESNHNLYDNIYREEQADQHVYDVRSQTDIAHAECSDYVQHGRYKKYGCLSVSLSVGVVDCYCAGCQADYSVAHDPRYIVEREESVEKFVPVQCEKHGLLC